MKSRIPCWIFVPILLGLVHSEPTALPARSPSTAPVMVVDSKGKVVGQEIGVDRFSNADHVLFKSAGVWFNLSANTGGFVNLTDLQLYYQSSDCSGTGYFPASFFSTPSAPLSFWQPVYAFIQGKSIEYADYKNVQNLTVQSQAFFRPDGTLLKCDPFTTQQQFVGAPILTTLLPSFLPPLSLK